MDKENTEVDEGLQSMVVGHILIRDLDTNEILLNQRDTLTNSKDNNASD